VSARDEKLIEQIQRATEGASRLLCTLARRGKTMERDEPQRTALLLAAVRSHPLYKGGRLAFDMLEIEDIMLDASSLDPMSTAEVVQVLRGRAHRLAEALARMGSRKEGRATAESFAADTEVSAGSVGRAPDGGRDEPSITHLPRVRLGPADSVAALADASAVGPEHPDARPRELELQASDYLYDFVVLGLLDVLGGTDSFPLPAS
jgi:hypothetical protein